MNIVLLRGLVREKRHWGDFPAKLKKAFPKAKVLTPEIQGVGEYHAITSPRNFDEMIAFMRKNISNDLSNGPTMVVAISLGGMLARRWDELYPGDFQKMVLINTSFKGINPLFKRLRFGSFMRFLKVFATRSAEKREELILQTVSNTPGKRKELLKPWIQIQADAPVNRLSALNQLAAALTFSPSKEAPNSDLLFLAGKKDRLCSYECSVKLHNLWGGQIEIHPKAGHDLPADDPDWLVEKISSFAQLSTNHS